MNHNINQRKDFVNNKGLYNYFVNICCAYINEYTYEKYSPGNNS